MTVLDSRALRTFLASFLVLFLEVALIRWMPAYIRLLAYFSNFILLASFLGIGIGCLLAPARSRLFRWFPLIQALVVGAVYFFRLEIGVESAGSVFMLPLGGAANNWPIQIEGRPRVPVAEQPQVQGNII